MHECIIPSHMNVVDHLPSVKDLRLSSLNSLEGPPFPTSSIQLLLCKSLSSKHLHLGSSETLQSASLLESCWMLTNLESIHLELPLTLCPSSTARNVPLLLSNCFSNILFFSLSDAPMLPGPDEHSTTEVLKASEAINLVLSALQDTVHTITFSTARWAVMDAFFIQLKVIMLKPGFRRFSKLRYLRVPSWVHVAIVQDVPLARNWTFLREVWPWGQLCLTDRPV